MPCPFSSLHADVTAHCPFLRSVLNRKSDANEVNVQPTGLCERASEHSQPEGYSFLNEPVRFAQAYAMVHGPGGALPHDEFDSKFHGADFALDSYYPTSMQAEADQTVSPCALGGASLPPRRRVLGPASISLAAGFPERPEYGVDKKNHNDTPAAAQQTVQAHPPSKQAREVSSVEVASEVEVSKCPLSKIPVVREVLGGLLYANPTAKYGINTIQMKCPSAIIKMRAAFAATAPMRALRPQDLSIRMAATAATSLVSNVPLGMWRDHLEKFSPAWFVAVHASIPLIVLMRKSALLPKYAIAATISCAILGQYLGSRYERARVAETGGVTVGALQAEQKAAKKAAKKAANKAAEEMTIQTTTQCGMRRDEQQIQEQKAFHGGAQCPLRKIDQVQPMIASAEETHAVCPLRPSALFAHNPFAPTAAVRG